MDVGRPSALHDGSYTTPLSHDRAGATHNLRRGGRRGVKSKGAGDQTHRRPGRFAGTLKHGVGHMQTDTYAGPNIAQKFSTHSLDTSGPTD